MCDEKWAPTSSSGSLMPPAPSGDYCSNAPIQTLFNGVLATRRATAHRTTANRTVEQIRTGEQTFDSTDAGSGQAEKERFKKGDGLVSYFVISGCFRSGTTLIRMCLSAHPDCIVLNEYHSQSYLAGKGELKNYPKNLGFKMPVAGRKIHNCMAGWEQDFQEEMKLVWLTRKPADFVASALQMGNLPQFLCQQMELEKTRRPDWAREFSTEIALADSAATKRERDLIYLALYWLDSERAYELCQTPKIKVGYENFVSSSQEILPILDFLNLENSHFVLSPEDNFDSSESWGLNNYEGNYEPKRPIDSNSIGKSKLTLSSRELELISRTTRCNNDL